MSGNENGLNACRDSPITLTMKTWFDKRKLNLNSGRLLAHEIGHALGANHDDGAKTQILLLESSCSSVGSLQDLPHHGDICAMCTICTYVYQGRG